MNEHTITRLSINLLIILVVLIFKQACTKNLVDAEGSIKIAGVYLVYDDSTSGSSLYYMSADYSNLEKIDSGTDIYSLYISYEKDLLVVASCKRLHFYNTRNHELLAEIDIPNTENPEPYIPYGKIDILPFIWDSNYCVLVNRSVYLINLESREISDIIWDSSENDPITSIHFIALSPDERTLYMELMQPGIVRIEGEFITYGATQRLASLELGTGKFRVIYNHPTDDPPLGSKFVFCTSEYVMAYDTNADSIWTFTAHDGICFNSFKVTEPDFLSSEHLNTVEYSFSQDWKSGSFYQIFPEEKRVKLYMSLPYNSIGHTTYQRLENGDIFASIPYTSDGAWKIVDLKKKEIVMEYTQYRDQLIYLVEDK